MIVKCTCTHVFQDDEYGKGYRVFNPTRKDNKISGGRCTVCGRIETRKADEFIENKKK